MQVPFREATAVPKFYENPLAFVSVLVALGIATRVGIWILQPLDRVAQNRRARIRFTVIDFMGLVFMLQIPMAMLRAALESLRPDGYRDASGEWILYLFVILLSGSIWTKAVMVFSQAGIHEARRRSLLVFLVLPVAYMGTFVAAMIPVVLLWGNLTWGAGTLLCGAMVVLVLAISFAGRISHRTAGISWETGLEEGRLNPENIRNLLDQQRSRKAK